jgi:glucose-6-phosphate isomerase
VQAEFDEQGLDSERAKFLLPFKSFCWQQAYNTILIEKLTPLGL